MFFNTYNNYDTNRAEEAPDEPLFQIEPAAAQRCMTKTQQFVNDFQFY